MSAHAVQTRLWTRQEYERLVADTLRTCFGPTHLVRVQMPLALGPDSEPAPDIAVVVGNARDYRDAHPQPAVLIVEVSDTTLTYDQERKARLYARAGIPEYRIVNLLERRPEVDRDPIATGAGGPAYRTRLILGPSETIAPLAVSSSSIAVADLLP